MPPNNLVSLLAAVREALSTPEALTANTTEEKEARLDLIDLLPELNASLVGDTAYLRELSWSAIHNLPLLAINRFNIAHHVPLATPISYTTLSSLTTLPIPLLKRIIRHAITSRLFHEDLITGQISHSSTSRLLITNPNLAAFVDLHSEVVFKSIAHTMDALEKWPGSTNPREAAYSLAIGRPGEVGLYEELMGNQERMGKFGKAMQFFSEGEGYEVGGLVEGYDWGRIGKGMVVDVGGAGGFVSAAISKAFPDLNFVVQDIRVCKDAEVEYSGCKLEWMVHDYFTPQTVVGADVYLYRFVFHNLHDDKAIQVLKAAVPAMKTGAKILINDECLSEPGQVRLQNEKAARALDAVMLACMSGREREVGEWENLFRKADDRYKFLSVSIAPSSRLWLVEAEWIG